MFEVWETAPTTAKERDRKKRLNISHFQLGGFAARWLVVSVSHLHPGFTKHHIEIFELMKATDGSKSKSAFVMMFHVTWLLINIDVKLTWTFVILFLSYVRARNTVTIKLRLVMFCNSPS